MMGGGLYISITERICRCRLECAVWLAETSFFYGADDTAEQPLTCILTPHHEFNVTVIFFYSSKAKGAITGSLDTLGLVYTVQ